MREFSGGTFYEFAVCQGAENPDKEKSDVGISGNVVLKLTSTLPAEQNRKIFADNCFTSVPPVDHHRIN